MSGGTRRRTSLDAEDARVAYMVDSTLSEIATSSQTPSAANAWGWFTAPSTMADDLAVPPPLPEGTIPDVRIEDFRRYLRTVGASLEHFEAGRAEAPAPRLSSDGPASPPAKARPLDGLAQAMTEVPLQYFREDFSLDWDLLGPIDTPEEQQAVVDELSAQLDRVETHLTSEIAGRYSSFFEASIYIQELSGDVQRLVDEVAAQRAAVGAVQADAQRGADDAAALRRRKQHLLETMQLAMAVQQIAQAKAAMQASLSAASVAGMDYVGALDVLEQLRESCRGPVMALRAVEDLPEYMDGVQGAMKDIMVADLIERTTLDVSRSLAAVLPGREAPPAPAPAEFEGPETVATLVLTLCKVDALADALHAVQKDLHRGMCTLLTSVVRAYLSDTCRADAEDVTDDLAPGPLSLALSRASGDQYIALLHLVLAAVKEHFAHCDARVVSVLSAALARAPSPPPGAPRLVAECAHRAAQLAVTFWGTLLTTWTTVAGPEKLGLAQLSAVLDVTDAFAALAEARLGKAVAILQGSVQQACKAALDLMHASNAAQLTLALEGERWAFAPLSEPCLRGLQRFVGDAAAAGEGATLGGKTYRFVEAAQALVAVLQANLDFGEAVPAFAADVAQRVVELLRSFNSRTCQLILGAGAMQLSGLKSITVKHLAVACHTVRAALALLPALTARFADACPPPRQALIAKELQRTAQDMATHCAEINNKIISIMCERLVPMHDFSRLLGASLAAPVLGGGPAAPPPPSGMAVNTMKQLQILGDILSGASQPEDKDAVMAQVLRNFVSVLTAAYDDDAGLAAAGLQGQAVTDLEFLVKSIRGLPLAHEMTEAGTQDMRALLLRKAAAVEAHRAAAAKAAAEKARAPSPPPPPAGPRAVEPAGHLAPPPPAAPSADAPPPTAPSPSPPPPPPPLQEAPARQAQQPMDQIRQPVEPAGHLVPPAQAPKAVIEQVSQAAPLAHPLQEAPAAPPLPPVHPAGAPPLPTPPPLSFAPAAGPRFRTAAAPAPPPPAPAPAMPATAPPAPSPVVAAPVQPAPVANGGPPLHDDLEEIPL